MSDLTDMFAEAMNSDDSVEIVEVEDGPVDNPDDGADDFSEVNDDADLEPDESDPADETADTDDDEPPADDDGDEDADAEGWWDEILDRYGDKTVPLTVNGEVVEKPLRELPNMAMMREDYSRKTAEVAQLSKAATWAQDVQAAFANDPVGTLQAFAQAYGIQLGADQPGAEPEGDPYEDLDPDVAAVLRKMDEQERRHEEELARVRETVNGFQQQQLMEEVKAEVQELRTEFGEDLDTTEMLRLAATYNMPLRDAAEAVVGRNYLAKSREQLAAEAAAREAAKTRTDQSRGKAKKRASSTATKRFDASDVSTEDFDTIGELFEIEMNSAS